MRLEPLSHDHLDELVVAASGNRSTYDFTWVPSDRDGMAGYISWLLDEHAKAHLLPFAQRRVDTGLVVGCTRFMEATWWAGRQQLAEVEIGGTWLSADAQRSAVNTEAKLLLLGHAFEGLGVWRVAICTDARNTRSRVAIERIGGVFEGVLRNHRLRSDRDGPTPRDSAMYSVIDSDWPSVRTALQQRLAARP